MAHINLADDDTESSKSNGKPERWFIGAYVPRNIKRALKDEGLAEHRSLSQQLEHILTERYNAPTKGKKK